MMDLNAYPPEIQEYISALKKRNVANADSILNDKTYVNYLYTQKLDEDYLKSMNHDRDHDLNGKEDE